MTKTCWHCNRPQGPWFVYVRKMHSAFWTPVFSGTKRQCDMRADALHEKRRRARKPAIADIRVMR